ncbi:MAG: inositol monophosphatase family protein [Phycisphaerales bacterium]
MHTLPAESGPIIHALAAAGKLTRAAQESLLSDHLTTKADGSEVTIADYAAQALINYLLSHSGVNIPAVIGEESSASLAASPALLAGTVALLRAHGWLDATDRAVLDAIDLGAPAPGQSPPSYFTIDPIDGTKGFARGRQFAVCFARIDNGICTFAALACPNLSRSSADSIDTPAPMGTLFVAATDTPAYSGLISRPDSLAEIPPRDAADIKNPVITFSVEPSEARLKNFDALAATLNGATRTPADSQAKYAMVARGQADAYFRPPRGTREKVWDHAAGCLILERTGCTVTDLQGRPIIWPEPSLPPCAGILGAPPGLHARILAALPRVNPLQ